MSTSYLDLVNVPSFGKKRESTFNPERGEMAYWCRDCRKQIDAIELPPQKIGKRLKEFAHECPICHGQRVAVGTVEGLREHYERKRV